MSTIPVNPVKKIHSKNEFELCYMRHQYLRRVTVMPTEAEMMPYYSIVKNFTKRTFFTYNNLFQLVGLDQDDVLNVGKIHLVSFLGLYAIEKAPEKYDKFVDVFMRKLGTVPGESDILCKNRANFTMFLKQRMEDLVRVCRQKARNIKGMQTDEYLVFYGSSAVPDDLTDITTTYGDLGFKKLDISLFKSVKKKMRDQDGPIFKLNDVNYIVVPVDHRNLELVDLQGAGLDPYDALHNLNPEQVYLMVEGEAQYEIKRKSFFAEPKEDRIKKLEHFISLHEKNPRYTEEVETARKMLK